MRRTPGVGYVLAPGRLAALVAVICMGLGGVAVALRPNDTVSRAAAAGAVVVSGLMAVALLNGWVEPRRADLPVKLGWPRALSQVALWVAVNVVGGNTAW